MSWDDNDDVAEFCQCHVRNCLNSVVRAGCLRIAKLWKMGFLASHLNVCTTIPSVSDKSRQSFQETRRILNLEMNFSADGISFFANRGEFMWDDKAGENTMPQTRDTPRWISYFQVIPVNRCWDKFYPGWTQPTSLGMNMGCPWCHASLGWIFRWDDDNASRIIPGYPLWNSLLCARCAIEFARFLVWLMCRVRERNFEKTERRVVTANLGVSFWTLRMYESGSS